MIHVIYVLKPKCTCELPGNRLAMWGGGPRFCISNKLSGNLSGMRYRFYLGMRPREARRK